ncbi:MAG TPA: stem cell self-renewal protein Piwi [Planktothrix sp. UBA8407]|jgi:Uncharacterized protein containing piwi/argonaute domain|nr:stem cell self-renewal protein Piwi [Planktothrix sp. UBA8407]HBK21758.1 stem cell self-renewal protein Piwi [Planktothrix sp. UBA10369]
MTNTTLSTAQSTTTPTYFLSEIFPLTIAHPNLDAFRLSPEVDRELGNKIGWRFCQKFENMIVIWETGYFWILGKVNQKLPEPEKWREALREILEELKDDIGDRIYSIQSLLEAQPTAYILAKLSVRILQIRRPFYPETIFSENQVEVKRIANFWAETIELNNYVHPVLVLTPKSDFRYQGTLVDYYENHPYRHKPEEILIGLKVRDREKDNFGIIVGLRGTIGENREKLLEYKPGSVSKIAIEDAPDDQPVVAVQFGKKSQDYHYAMAALCPSITEDNVHLFDVKYGDLLIQTKIKYQKRQEYLNSYKHTAQKCLSDYGFTIEKSINSFDNSPIFSLPSFSIEDTPLLFGNGFRGKRSAILKGLKNGVYRRNEDYQDPLRAIRINILKIGEFKVSSEFLEKIQTRLKQYNFNSLNLIDPKTQKVERDRVKSISIEGLSDSEAKAAVEEALEQLLVIKPDIILTFLPQSDRHSDETEEGSFYSFISSRILRRGVASQIIYEETIKDSTNHGNILNQVIPGILAKLGNLPFILAEPLKIADYFIGLDISRKPKKKGTGSLNVCASVRLYNKRGEFIRYGLEDALTEGEEIDKQTLEKLLPFADLREKTVLIYRDGLFRGNEVKHLQERAKAIRSKFILVECIKTGVPRLYNISQQILKAPTRGLSLRLSSSEVLLVTTQLKSENMGVPFPLRLRVIPDPNHAEPISLEDLVEATLKLTLLHHGALKEPRLPVPLFGSDRIAYRRLQGISPSSSQGDKQFWL